MANQAKENVLKKIREALSQPAPIPFPKSEGKSSVFLPATQDLEVEFAEQFTQLLGKFAFCLNEAELQKQVKRLIAEKEWDKVFCKEPVITDLLENTGNLTFLSESNELATCDASITSCECLIARTGSILLSSAQLSGRETSIYAPVHICIAYTNQLVYDIKDGLELMKEKYSPQLPSLITLATGPSRTADIEKTLVVGVHGPKEVYVFLVENN